MTPKLLDRKSFGKRIRALRILKEYTQEKLGDLVDLNVESIRSYEAGNSVPKLDGLVSISTVFSVPIEWLLTGEGEIDSTASEVKEFGPADEMIAETQDKNVSSKLA